MGTCVGVYKRVCSMWIPYEIVSHCYNDLTRRRPLRKHINHKLSSELSVQSTQTTYRMYLKIQNTHSRMYIAEYIHEAFGIELQKHLRVRNGGKVNSKWHLLHSHAHCYDSGRRGRVHWSLVYQIVYTHKRLPTNTGTHTTQIVCFV